MKNAIIEFLKKNIMTIGLVVIVFVFIGMFACDRQRLIGLTQELTTLNNDYNSLKEDRDLLKLQRDSLENQNKSLAHQKDLLKSELRRKESYLAYIEKKHEQEIDSLMNVPADTVYSRLQAIYPNSDNSLMRFPFSQSQIIPIYSNTLRLPRLQKQYDMQSDMLFTCNELNKKYQDIENNYKSQVDNLKRDIGACNSQLGIRDEQLKLTEKQLNRKSFWNWVFKGTTIIFGTLAAVK